MIVADTNLLVGLYLPSSGTGIAERVLNRDPVWSVPLLWRSEFRNVLAEGLNTFLVTSDRQVLKAFPEKAVAPEVFVGAT